MRTGHDGKHWNMHGGELLFSKKYGEPDGWRRRIFSPTSHRDIVRHFSGALCERGGTVTDLVEDGGGKWLTCFEGVDLVSDIDHVHHHVGLCGIVERITVDSVEVNETGDYIWITAADPAQLFTSDRMSGQDGMIELQRLDDYQDIFSQPLGGVVGDVGAGLLEAPKPRRVMAYTWWCAVNCGASFSKSCAVAPRPARKTRGRPMPPQSRTSRLIPFSTVTVWATGASDEVRCCAWRLQGAAVANITRRSAITAAIAVVPRSKAIAKMIDYPGSWSLSDLQNSVRLWFVRLLTRRLLGMVEIPGRRHFSPYERSIRAIVDVLL